MDSDADSKRLPRLNPWPALFDLLQGATGLALTLFLFVHLCLEASILISHDAMYFIARMFEGEPLFGEPYPILVSLIGIIVLGLIMLHALFAMRKIPASYQRYSRLHSHNARFPHKDTRLWMVQVVSGFLLFFLVAVHLFQVIMHPGDIGPYASSDRVWSGGMWPLYLLLLLIAIPHAVIGIYRLAVKWGMPAADNPRRTRQRMRTLVWILTGIFVSLSLFTLARYMAIGIEHADRAGERYHPIQQPQHNTPVSSEE